MNKDMELLKLSWSAFGHLLMLFPSYGLSRLLDKAFDVENVKGIKLRLKLARWNSHLAEKMVDKEMERVVLQPSPENIKTAKTAHSLHQTLRTEEDLLELILKAHS